jgi:uncharacterized protein
VPGGRRIASALIKAATAAEHTETAGRDRDDGADGTSPSVGATSAAGELASVPADQEPGGDQRVFRIVELFDVTVELPATYAVANLVEREAPARRLDIPLALADGTALAYALRRIETPRPLTHELFAGVLRRLGAEILAVRLVGRTGGTYLAELDLTGPGGRQVVGCRPSDGLALAVRQSVAAPVLADERLLDGDGDVAPGEPAPGDLAPGDVAPGDMADGDLAPGDVAP